MRKPWSRPGKQEWMQSGSRYTADDIITQASLKWKVHFGVIVCVSDFSVTAVSPPPLRKASSLHTSVQQIWRAGTLLVKHLPKAGRGAESAGDGGGGEGAVCFSSPSLLELCDHSSDWTDFTYNFYFTFFILIVTKLVLHTNNSPLTWII